MRLRPGIGFVSSKLAKSWNCQSSTQLSHYELKQKEEKQKHNLGCSSPPSICLACVSQMVSQQS